MSDKDCKTINVDVLGPRVPSLIVSTAAIVIAVFALLKVIELESEIKETSRE